MGYSTHYTLEHKYLDGPGFRPSCKHTKPKGANFCPVCGLQIGNIARDQDISNWISENWTDYPEDNYSSGEMLFDSEGVKWYDNEKDMLALSKAFPGILFTLHGEGEESGDIWNKYFLNGKMQVAKAEFAIAEFDPDLLQ